MSSCKKGHQSNNSGHEQNYRLQQLDHRFNKKIIFVELRLKTNIENSNSKK